jgi:hypothetical protein
MRPNGPSGGALENLLSAIAPGVPDDTSDDEILLEELERRHA